MMMADQASKVSEFIESLSLNEKEPGVTPLAEPPLRVAAFNIQIFGTKKVNKKDVTHVLLKIISRYDLVLIQEVRDSSQTAIDRLLQQLNKLEADDPFSCEVSERLGRSNSKEQYVFLYRGSRLQLIDTYQYDDGLDDGSDAFQREPFAVRFASLTTEVKDFGVIAIHTDPEDAVKEISALYSVYQAAKRRWNLEDILIAGDFNADEGYVDQDDWSKIKLRTDRRFKWLIDDETDTTVGNTDRAYDRFVAVGKNLNKGIVPGSAKCYRFDDDLKLPKDEAEDVSDHYPIELQLCGKVCRAVQREVGSEVGVVVHQTRPLDNVNAARRVYRADTEQERAAFRCTVLRVEHLMTEVRASRSGVSDVVQALRQFQEAFPDVLNDHTLSLVAAYMTSPLMTSSPWVYGLVKDEAPSPSYDVTVTVTLQEPYLCRVMVTKRVS